MQKLIKNRFWFLVAMLALTAFFGWGISLIRTEFSFDKFRAGRDGEVGFYETYKENFPHEENAIQLALKGPDSTIWDIRFLTTVDSVFEAISQFEDVDTTISPTRLESMRWTGLGVSRSPLIAFGSEKDLLRSQKKLARDSLLYSNFFTEDRSLLAGIVLVDPDILDKDERDVLSNKIEDLMQGQPYDFVISGIPFIRTQYVRTIRGEMASFVILSVGLTILVMLFLYRSFWGVALPILVVGLGMVWTIGFMGVGGAPLDMLANLIPSIMFVVGIADTIHLITRYQQDLGSGLEPKVAMASTLKEIGLAIFLTSLTTAIGFASLVVSPLAPIQKFGLFAAAGVLFAYIISIILVPNALLNLKPERITASKGFGSNPIWDRFLKKMYTWVRHKPWQILGVTVAILVLSGWGISKISLNTYLLDDISKNDPARTSMEFFEDNFYGARPLEMAIIPKNGKLLTDLELLRDVDKIQDHLRSNHRISPFFSLVTYLKGINRLVNGGNDRHFVLPESDEELEELIGYGYLSSSGEEMLARVMTEDRSMGRLSAQMSDIGSYAFADLRAELDSFIVSECNPANFDYRFTGSPVIVEENVGVLRSGLFTGLAMAFALVALLMGLLFRSWRMLIIGVIPNIIPLVITAGLMGFLGITLRASTSIVYLIAFGVAVDDTIHFLGRLRIEIKEGRGREEAIYNTLMGTGKALILTTIILVAGFSMLLTSSFGGTFAVGVFTGLTLLVALASDLLLLPVLVRWGKVGKPDAEEYLEQLEDESKLSIEN